MCPELPSNVRDRVLHRRSGQRQAPTENICFKAGGLLLCVGRKDNTVWRVFFYQKVFVRLQMQLVSVLSDIKRFEGFLVEILWRLYGKLHAARV